jgi:hypothetical protein
MQERIKAWTEQTMKADAECGLEQCYRCKGIPDQFKRHDRRSRVFLLVAREVVRRFDSFVVRWKCPICGKVLTELPSFGLRFKRYVAQTVLPWTSTYLQADLRVANGVVTDDDGRAVTYVKTVGRDEQFCTEQLWASTVRRWAQWLDGLTQTLREAKRLLQPLQANGQSRRWQPSQGPYPTARDVLSVDAQFQQVFGHSVFPKFASQHGWR